MRRPGLDNSHHINTVIYNSRRDRRISRIYRAGAKWLIGKSLVLNKARRRDSRNLFEFGLGQTIGRSGHRKGSYLILKKDP